MNSKFFLWVSLMVLSGCATLPPKNPDNLCSILREKPDWYPAADAAYRRWGTPISVQMSILRQESAFVADAKPPRPTILGFIPWFRSSSAYGYPQAKDETWDDYRRASGNRWASREDFADSCDFVAWYCAVSHNKLNIPFTDVDKLYFSYHEGLGGYRRQSHLAKPWLLNTAKKVQHYAKRYEAQFQQCRVDWEIGQAN